MNRLPEIDYRLRGLARGAHPGAHRGRNEGHGWAFQTWAPFLAHPDGRRLDVRRSLVDPLQNHWVRVHQQPVRIDLWVIADLSGSMAYAGNVRKLAFLADLLEALAYSSDRIGDRLGFLGCAEHPLTEFFMPAQRNVGSALNLARRLRGWVPAGSHARGLLDAVPYLTRRRSLVLLVSDFHVPFGIIRQSFERLSRHDLVPVVLWDAAEQGRQLAGSGPRRLADLETGRERTLWLRTELRERLQDSFDQRRERLIALARAYGCEPLFVEGGNAADPFNRYFAVRR